MKIMLTFLLLSVFCSSAYAQQPANATIWFYRPADATGTSRTVYRIGGITDRIATIEPGEFFGLPVSAGIHTFSHTQAPARGQLVAVSVLAGQQAYVEVQPDAFQMVAPEKGIATIQSSKPIAVNSALNSAVIVPSAAPVAAAILPAPVPQPPPLSATTAPSSASAQQSAGADPPSDPNEFRRFEIGWNILSYSRQGEVNQYGGTLGLAVGVSDSVAIVADLGVHSGTYAGFDVETTTYRFGPKISWRHGRRVTTFSQFLAGGVRFTGSGTAFIGGTTITASESVNGFSMYVGGGIDIGIRPWFAFRVIEGGYSGLYFSDGPGYEGGWSNGYRISGGIVFRFGGD